MRILFNLHLLIFVCFLQISCQKKAEIVKELSLDRPTIEELGKKIKFPQDERAVQFIADTICKVEKIEVNFQAPAKVTANVIRNINNKSYNMVMFSDPDLSANFSIYLERVTNIKTYKLNLERVEELFANGAATGREVLEAKAALQNEEAALIENESKFLQAGLEPEDIFSHKVGTVWVICDIPDTDIDKIKLGKKCKVISKAYENEVFYGITEDLADYVDNTTRMVKLRIELHNNNNKLKAGMFVIVEFGLIEGTFLCVPTKSVITVQGKDYVFVRNSKFDFERKEVVIGQQFNDRTVIISGIRENENIVTEGVIQLKGLSFGY